MDFLNLWITRSYWNQTSFVRYSNTRQSQWNWSKWIIFCFHGKKLLHTAFLKIKGSGVSLNLFCICLSLVLALTIEKLGNSVEQLYNKLFENVRMYIPTYIFWFKWSTCNYEKRNNFTLDIYLFKSLFKFI